MRLLTRRVRMPVGVRCLLMTQSGHVYPLLRPPILLGFEKKMSLSRGWRIACAGGISSEP